MTTEKESETAIPCVVFLATTRRKKVATRYEAESDEDALQLAVRLQTAHGQLGRGGATVILAYGACGKILGCWQREACSEVWTERATG